MSIEKNGKTGRRVGPSQSREALLGAARVQFALHGYERATLRAIAADAGVDPGLIRHFFGGKDDLFAATIELPPELVSAVIGEFRAGTEGLGERVTRRYLGLWEDQQTGPVLISLTRTALTHEPALEHFREFLMATVVRQAGTYIPGSNPELRLNLAMGSLLGVALTRHIYRTPPTANASIEQLVTFIAPTVEQYLVGDVSADSI